MTKVYDGPAIRSIYAQLVHDFGGYDAAAAVLNLNKGTIKKQIDGTANIGPAHFATLEDSLGRYPITNLLAGREGRSDNATDRSKALMDLVRESGEATLAVAGVLAGGADADTKAAIKELQEALDAGKAAMDALLAGGDE